MCDVSMIEVNGLKRACLSPSPESPAGTGPSRFQYQVAYSFTLCLDFSYVLYHILKLGVISLIYS